MYPFIGLWPFSCLCSCVVWFIETPLLCPLYSWCLSHIDFVYVVTVLLRFRYIWCLSIIDFIYFVIYSVLWAPSTRPMCWPIYSQLLTTFHGSVKLHALKKHSSTLMLATLQLFRHLIEFIHIYSGACYITRNLKTLFEILRSKMILVTVLD